MRVLMLVFLVSWFTLAMPSTPVHTQDSPAEAALASVISDFERILKRADPITAGLDGDRDALRRLPDPSRDTELANGRELSAIGAKLAQISIRDLSSASALNHQVLSRAIAEAVEQVGFDFDRIAFQNDSGFHTLGDYLGRTTTIASRDDADAWLARLEALPAYYEQNIAQPAARHQDPIHAADASSSIACSRSPAGRRTAKAGRQLAAAAVRAHARGHPAGGASRISRRRRSRSCATASCPAQRAFADVHGAGVRAGGASRASAGARRRTARPRIGSSSAVRPRRT